MFRYNFTCGIIQPPKTRKPSIRTIPAFWFFYSCDFDELIATAKQICGPIVPNYFLCMPHTSTIFWHEISSKLVQRFPTHFILRQSDEPSLLRNKCWNNAPNLLVFWWGFPWCPCRIARLRRQRNGGSWPVSEGPSPTHANHSPEVSFYSPEVSFHSPEVSFLFKGFIKDLWTLACMFFFPVHCAKVKHV